MKDTKELTRKAREIYYHTMDEILEVTGDGTEAEYLLAEVVKNLAQELSTWVWEDLETNKKRT